MSNDLSAMDYLSNGAKTASAYTLKVLAAPINSLDAMIGSPVKAVGDMLLDSRAVAGISADPKVLSQESSSLDISAK